MNNSMSLKDYITQLEGKSYLDRLLEDQTLKFLMDKNICGSGHLVVSSKLESIIVGIDDTILHRGLDLYFELEHEGPEGTLGVLLHNFDRECEKPYASKFASVLVESYNCIVVGCKIDGTKSECYDCSKSEMKLVCDVIDDDDEE